MDIACGCRLHAGTRRRGTRDELANRGVAVRFEE